jgi:hypothetical protein
VSDTRGMLYATLTGETTITIPLSEVVNLQNELAAETARADRAEGLRGGLETELGRTIRWYDEARAERDKAQRDLATLRGALEEIKSTHWGKAHEVAGVALASVPSHSPDPRDETIATLRESLESPVEWVGIQPSDADELVARCREALASVQAPREGRTPIVALKLACSRCGAAVSRSWEPGRCFVEDDEPAECAQHDEAESWDEVNGEPWRANGHMLLCHNVLQARAYWPQDVARLIELLNRGEALASVQAPRDFSRPEAGLIPSFRAEVYRLAIVHERTGALSDMQALQRATGDFAQAVMDDAMRLAVQAPREGKP